MQVFRPESGKQSMRSLSQSSKRPCLRSGIRVTCIILISVAFCACMRRTPLEQQSALMIRVQGEGMLSPSELQALAQKAESAQYQLVPGNPATSGTLSITQRYPWAADDLEARATEPIEQNLAPLAERLMAARLAARDSAWEEMGKALLSLPLGNATETLGEELGANPGLRRKVEQTIRDAQIEESEDAQSSQSLCIARLPLSAIASLLLPIQEPALTMNPPNHGTLPYPRNPIEASSFAKALAQARELLQSKITEIPVSKKETAGTLMATKAAARQVVQEAVKAARADILDFPRDGACIVRLTFDATRLIDDLRVLQKQ